MLFGFIITALPACRFPQDPNHTLERVRGNKMQVGVVENRPWVIRADNEAAGVEAALIREFAQELDAEIEWVWGSEQEHMEALERFELDVVVTGLTKATPWSSRVALTTPYIETPIKVGLPPSAAPLATLEGVEIAVAQGSAVATYVEEEEAIPVPVEDLSQVEGPIAAPEWQLEDWGFVVTDFTLHTEQHVMATPPGENGWLVRLERFLFGKDPSIKDALQQAEPQ